MHGKLARHDLRSVTVVIILVTLSLGCLCLPAGIIPTIPAPTQPVKPIVTVPPVLVPPTVEPPVSNTSGLAPNEPWLLIETEQGLWGANADGSGMTQLTDVDYWDWNLANAVQPGGNQVVFLSPATYDFHNMTLNLLSLPDGTITKITDLTSPETEAYADLEMGDDGSEAIWAVRNQHNYAWSPDGTRLAFVGLMDGPSAEIYLYNDLSGVIQRVSNDEAQNYWPSWSPDGNALLYFGAKTFGTGAGFDTTGVWYAQGDGTDASLLYVPEGDIEEVVGWLDNKTVVLDTWSMYCDGSGKLRLYDLISRQVTMLNEDCFISAAAENLRGSALFANSSGLYLLTAEDRAPVRVSQEEVARIDPVEPGEYFFTVYFTNGSLATYGTSEMDYQVSPVENDSVELEVVSYALIWAWTSEGVSQPGVWITGPGIEIGQIFDKGARLPIWDKNNNLLFFAPKRAGGYDLYRTTFEAYYRDLAVVGSIDPAIYRVVWLGGQ